MNLGENIRIAFEGLKANKMRALLTMLGIIIGIASVIAILTVGNSLSGAITNSMGSLGATNIYVYLQNKEEAAGGQFGGMMVQPASPDDDSRLTDEMVENLLHRYPNEVAGVSMAASAGRGRAQDGRLYANVSLSGVNAYYTEGNNIEILAGRTITERDIDGLRNSAVVSDKLVNNMFGGNAQSALGEELKVTAGDDAYTFNIVGVYKYVQAGMSFSTANEKDISTDLLLPITTVKRMTNSPEGYDYLVVTTRNTQDTAAFVSQLKNFFNRYYEKNDKFQATAMSMENILDQVDTVMGTISIALSIIAGISLLVGGIGVMNIMLVSVTERTREIGTRKALGATNANIRIQFVVESTIVCMIGGAIGVVLGGALGYLGSSLIGTPVGPDVPSILIAVGFSMGIGVFFGYYPANKAARLDPIEALRYE